MEPAFKIPTIGDRVELSVDWTFPLFEERRNKPLFKVVAPEKKITEYHMETLSYEEFHAANPTPNAPPRAKPFGDNPENLRQLWDEYKKTDEWRNHIRLYWEANNAFQLKNSISVTLPAGTCLEVDRIYIRQKSGEFDSVTFKIRADRKSPYNNVRFWVKRSDANNIVGVYIRADEFNMI